MSFGWSLSTFVRLTPKPAFWSVALAWSKVSPTTFGRPTGFGPIETLICTGEPLVTFVPACGNWPVTVFGGLSEWSSTTFGLRPAVVSVLTASSRVLLRTSGTMTFGFPVETFRSTVLFFATCRPAFGSWSIT